MKKQFKINHATYYLPTSWQEVTFDQYNKVTALDEALSGTDKAANILSILSGVPMETLEEAGAGLVVPLFNELAFMETLPEAVMIEHVQVLGKNYYAQKITTVGELAAFDRISSAEGISEGEKLPYVLAILLRRMEKMSATAPTWLDKLLGRKNGTEPAEATYEAFRNEEKWVTTRAKMFGSQLSPVEVLGLASFFLHSEQLSQLSTQRSSHPARVLRLTSKLSQAMSAASTVGRRPSTTLNRTFSTMLRFYISMLERSLTSCSMTAR